MANPELNQNSKEFRITGIPTDIITAAIVASELSPNDPSRERFLAVANALRAQGLPGNADTANALEAYANFAFDIYSNQPKPITVDGSRITKEKLPDGEIPLATDLYQVSYSINTPPNDNPNILNITPNKQALLKISLNPGGGSDREGRQFFGSSIAIIAKVGDSPNEWHKWEVSIKILDGLAELTIIKARAEEQDGTVVEIPESIDSQELIDLINYLQTAN